MMRASKVNQADFSSTVLGHPHPSLRLAASPCLTHLSVATTRCLEVKKSCQKNFNRLRSSNRVDGSGCRWVQFASVGQLAVTVWSPIPNLSIKSYDRFCFCSMSERCDTHRIPIAVVY